MKELLVKHNQTTFHDFEKPLTKTNTIEHEIPPFDHVVFDVIGPLPITTNGNRFILTMIDYFLLSGQRLMPFLNKTVTVADCIVNRWTAHHGITIRIHIDNTPEFRAHIITTLKKMLSMKVHLQRHTGLNRMVYLNA